MNGKTHTENSYSKIDTVISDEKIINFINVIELDS